MINKMRKSKIFCRERFTKCINVLIPSDYAKIIKIVYQYDIL